MNYIFLKVWKCFKFDRGEVEKHTCGKELSSFNLSFIALISDHILKSDGIIFRHSVPCLPIPHVHIVEAMQVMILHIPRELAKQYSHIHRCSVTPGISSFMDLNKNPFALDVPLKFQSESPIFKFSINPSIPLLLSNSMNNDQVCSDVDYANGILIQPYMLGSTFVELDRRSDTYGLTENWMQVILRGIWGKLRGQKGFHWGL